MSQEQANAASVKVELRADCFAGAWAKGEFEQGFLEDGDVNEAINTGQPDRRRSPDERPLRRRSLRTAPRAAHEVVPPGVHHGRSAQCDTGKP